MKLTAMPLQMDPSHDVLQDKATETQGKKGLASVHAANLLSVALPFIAMLAAFIIFWGRGFNRVQFALYTGMYLLTGFGVTIGYHRLFTHRAFETSTPMRCILAILGSMAAQGRMLTWVANHRKHHQHSDTESDPHSPNTSGQGFLGTLRGLWHAHLGWMFVNDAPDLVGRYVPDLAAEKPMWLMDRLFWVWVALGLMLPALLGALVTRSWSGAMLGFLWAGLVRIVMVHHITFSVNSICHVWGKRPYQSRDMSRNNAIVGVLALGEGWHNNHHAFPTSARHGLRWWQFDSSYLLIRGMEKLRLVWKVKIPSADAISAKRVQAMPSAH